MTRSIIRGSAVLAALLFVSAAALPARAAWRYEGGAAFADGRYLFDLSSTTWTLTNGIAFEAERWSARISVPAHLQTSGLVSWSAAGPLPSGGALQGEVAEGGRDGHGRRSPAGRARIEVPADYSSETDFNWGDPVAMIAATPWKGAAASLTLTAAVKAPVASPEEYGTGAWDAGASLGVARSLGSRWIVSAEAGWWALGDLDSLVLRNSVHGTLAVGRVLGTAWFATASAMAGSSAIEGYDSPRSAGLTVARTVGRGTVSGGVFAGLSETVPDVTVSLSWSVSLGPP